MTGGWRVVAQYQGSNGRSIHTVERDGVSYRCTCQGFRIQKKGYCKHTRLAQGDNVDQVRVRPQDAGTKKRAVPAPRPATPRKETLVQPELRRRRIRFDEE